MSKRSRNYTLTRLREQLRLERGLEDTADGAKTAAMFRLERKFGQDIRVLLVSLAGETGIQVAARLSVSPAAVSKWRKRLGIEALAQGRPQARAMQ